VLVARGRRDADGAFACFSAASTQLFFLPEPLKNIAAEGEPNFLALDDGGDGVVGSEGRPP